MSIQISKINWGWKNNFLFAWVQFSDSLVRVLSFGVLSTTWVGDFVQNQGRKILREKARSRK